MIFYVCPWNLELIFWILFIVQERFSAGPFPINDHLYDDTTISDNEHFLEVLRTLESDNKSNIAVSKNTDEYVYSHLFVFNVAYKIILIE